MNNKEEMILEFQEYYLHVSLKKWYKKDNDSVAPNRKENYEITVVDGKLIITL